MLQPTNIHTPEIYAKIYAKIYTKRENKQPKTHRDIRSNIHQRKTLTYTENHTPKICCYPQTHMPETYAKTYTSKDNKQPKTHRDIGQIYTKGKCESTPKTIPPKYIVAHKHTCRRHTPKYAPKEKTNNPRPTEICPQIYTKRKRKYIYKRTSQRHMPKYPPKEKINNPRPTPKDYASQTTLSYSTANPTTLTALITGSPPHIPAMAIYVANVTMESSSGVPLGSFTSMR